MAKNFDFRHSNIFENIRVSIRPKKDLRQTIIYNRKTSMYNSSHLKSDGELPIGFFHNS